MRRNPSAAEDAFTRAIELDPEFGPAYRDRGLARVELGRLREAERDFTEALELNYAPLQVHTLRANVRDRLRDAAGAAADRQAVKTLSPESDYDFVTRGYTRMMHDPKGALADFRAAEEKNPRSLPALKYQSHLLSNVLRDPTGALAVADRMVEFYPSSSSVRAERAVCLARLGRREEAHREADRCRRLVDALTARERDPRVVFQLACVYSLTSKDHPGDRSRAFVLLREALRTGPTEVRAFERSRDLDPIRDLPEFDPLMDAVKELAQ
jgi:tetratricopeptide (TPR) repeat protein